MAALRLLAVLCLLGQEAPPKNPVVIVETSLGIISIELYADKAPVTVKNFQTYVEKKHYDGTLFHRVVGHFMIQGGGFDKDLKERETGKPIRNESDNGLKNLRGTVAMARKGDPDSATSQFFVNVKDNASLDRTAREAGYCVFGKVVEGMDVVDRIKAVRTTVIGPHKNVPREPVVIVSARNVSE